ncbi:MAG: zinc ABC transporter substrate-binding protein [Clostridia bacterium]|nr:zinc ABC transporter substrate-binding protein [Clostridia bacterium]MBR2735253.1 zinc ABC transporter substrate-binding protein [Clostridia bacterium]
MKLLKKIAAPILSVISLFILSGCGKKESSVNFVTSCYPVHIIAMNIADGVDDVEIKKMSENHSGCLHDFQLQTKDLKNIEKSSAFIINGAGMENFLDKITEENQEIKIIDSSKGIALIEEEHDHDECEDEDCCHDYHSGSNPHIWLSPENYIVQIKNICEGMKFADPKNAEKYEQNADIYINKIRDLKIKMHDKLQKFEGQNIITFHNAFPYFAKEFSINILGVINHEPGEEPSAKEILETVSTIKQNDIKAIFTEPQYVDNAAKTISNETGVQIYTLDPCVTGSNDKNAYINTMEKNLEILKIAFSE